MSEDIRFIPRGGQVPNADGLAPLLNEAKAAGFTTLGMYSVKDNPGLVVYAMQHRQADISATIFLPNPNLPPIVAVSTFYTDGTSHSSLINLPVAVLPDMEHFMMPVPPETIQQLLSIHKSSRKIGPGVRVTMDNYIPLAQKAFSRLVSQIIFFADDSFKTLSAEEQQDAAIDRAMKNLDALVDDILDGDPSLEEEFSSLVNGIADDDAVRENLENEVPDKPVAPPVNTPSPDMGQLADEFKALDDWYQANDSEMVEILRPGCSDEFIAKLEKKLDCKLPDDIKALYKWHDGIRDDEGWFGLGNGRPFLSLKAALRERELMLDSIPGQWAENWLPIMGEADEGFFIILDKEQKSHTGIYRYNIQDDPLTLEYIHVLGMIRMIRAGLDAGLLQPVAKQEAMYFEVFYDDRLVKIRKDFNPAAYPFLKKKGVTFFDWPEDEIAGSDRGI